MMNPETGSVQHGGAISPSLATAINTGAAALLKDNKEELCHAVVIAQQLAADLSTRVKGSPAEPLAADLETSAQGILDYIGCAGGPGGSSSGVVTGAGGSSSGPGGSGPGGIYPGYGVGGAPLNAAATGAGIVAGTQPPNAATAAAAAAATAAAAGDPISGSSSGAPPNSSAIAAAGPKKKGWWPFSSSGSPAAPPPDAAAATTAAAVGPQAQPPAATARSWIPSIFRRTPKADPPPAPIVDDTTHLNPFANPSVAGAPLAAAAAPAATAPVVPTPAAQPQKRGFFGKMYNSTFGTPEQQLQKAIAAANLDTEIESPGEITEETGTRTHLEAARQQVIRARNARKASNAPATAALLKSVKNFKKDKNAYTAAVARKRKTQKRGSPISSQQQGPGVNASFSMANPMRPSAAVAPRSTVRSLLNPPNQGVELMPRGSSAPGSVISSRPAATAGNTNSFSMANPLLSASVAGPRASQSTVASLLRPAASAAAASAAAGPASESGLTPALAERFKQAPKQSSSWFSGFTRKNPVSSKPNARTTVNAKSKGWSLFGKRPESTPVTLGGTLPLAQQGPPSAATTPTPTIPLLAAPVPSNPEDVPVLLERPPAGSALQGNWDAMAALRQRALDDRTQLTAYTRARDAYSTAAALNTVARRNAPNAPPEGMAAKMTRIGGTVPVTIPVTDPQRPRLEELLNAVFAEGAGANEEQAYRQALDAALARLASSAVSSSSTQPRQRRSASLNLSNATAGLSPFSSSSSSSTAAAPLPATAASTAPAAAAATAPSLSAARVAGVSTAPAAAAATASSAPSLSAARVAGVTAAPTPAAATASSAPAPAAPTPAAPAPAAAKKPEYYSTLNWGRGITKEQRDRLTAKDNLKKYSKLPLPAGPSSSALKLTLDKFQTLVASGVDTADLSYVGAFNENMREYERVIKEEQAAAKAAQAAQPVRALAPGTVLGTSLPGAGLNFYSQGTTASKPKAVALASSPNSSGPAFAASLAAKRVAANAAQAAAEGARSRELTRFNLSQQVSPLATYRAPGANVLKRVPAAAAAAAPAAKPAPRAPLPATAFSTSRTNPFGSTGATLNDLYKQYGVAPKGGRRTKRSKPSKARKTARR